MLKLNLYAFLVLSKLYLYLNTSYVEVKRISNISAITFPSDLNTSYVEVKPLKIALKFVIKVYLNTSYVEVKH